MNFFQDTDWKVSAWNGMLKKTQLQFEEGLDLTELFASLCAFITVNQGRWAD